MRFLAGIPNHLDRYAEIGDLGMSIIGVSISLLVLLYLVHIFYKKELFSRNEAILGSALRVVFLISLGVEFLHKIISNSNTDIINSVNVVRGLWNNLFFGYMIVVGIYYILTMKESKYKGYFYSFDTLIMSTPIIYKVFIVLVGIFKFDLVENLKYILLEIITVVIVVLTIYFFFKMYWKKSAKRISLFYFFSLIGLLLGLIEQSSNFTSSDRTALLVSSLFLFLLGSYEMVYYLIHKKNKEESIFTKTFTTITACICIILLNPFYNLFDYSIDNTQPIWDSTVRENASLSDIKTCEMIARKALNDYDSPFNVIGSGGGILYYEIESVINDYRIRFFSTNNRIFSIYRKSRDVKVVYLDEIKSKEEIKDMTVKWLKSIDNPYNPLVEEMIIEENDEVFKIKFPLKFTNGEIADQEHNLYNDGRDLVWSKDGKLIGYNSNFGLYPLSYFDDIEMTESNVKDIVTKFYEKLNNDVPPYVINNISNDYSSNPIVNIYTKHKETLRIDTLSGDIIRYSAKNKKAVSAKTENKDKVLGYFKLFYDDEEYSFKIEGTEYIFSNEKDKIIIKLDNDEELVSFYKWKTKNNNKPTYSEFKISRNRALKSVKNLYKPWQIYKSKVSLGMFIDQDNNCNYGYIIEITPFGKKEHHVYRVDSETGNVKALYDFGKVIKNE
ncbi:hypothetical protein [Abyssisolibacter fermentans]|uniref:hypothetical protein n=1 Tax=Abyssisolibacter fermentans TaxID=1766203 RepID=UPI000835D0DD|nr:hypothetical protein [Abyssisolibacter fermentans]